MPIKWLAPENITKQTYSHASDAWMFGVLMWEIFANCKEPYPGMLNAEVMKKVTKESYTHYTPHTHLKTTT